MDEIMKSFFTKSSSSRQLHYVNKVKELQQAKEMRTFLDEARRTGLSLTLGIAVDAWVCPIELDLYHDPGRELSEWLLNFICGLCHRIQAEIDELLILWPTLADLTYP